MSGPSAPRLGALADEAATESTESRLSPSPRSSRTNLAGLPSIVGFGQSLAAIALRVWPGATRNPVAAKNGRPGAGGGVGGAVAVAAATRSAEGAEPAAGKGSKELAIATTIRSISVDCA